MNSRTALMLLLVASLMAVAGCDDRSPVIEDDSAAGQREYSRAEIARRAEAIALLQKFHGRALPLRVDRPITKLGFSGPGMTEQNVRDILQPFADEIEDIYVKDVKLTPEFLDYLASLPRLNHLSLKNSELRASDFKRLRGSNVSAVLRPDNETNALWMIPDEEFRFSRWVTSTDDKLSMRVMVKAEPVTAGDLLILYVELRNNSDEPVFLPRPFGVASTEWPEVQGPSGVVAFVNTSGGTRRLTITSREFLVLRPRDYYRAAKRLPLEMWPGTGKAGKYVLSYRYVARDGSGPAGTWPTFVQRYARRMMERYGVTDTPVAWLGEIQSPSITIEKR